MMRKSNMSRGSSRYGFAAVMLCAMITNVVDARTTPEKFSLTKKNVAFERAMKMGIYKGEKERLRKEKLNKKILENAVFVPPSSNHRDDKPSFLQHGRQLADDGDDDNYYGFGFDISQYSLKYTQCQAISTWSDELAEDEESDSVLKAQRFALFRFCPSESCSANNKWGCDYNYGEYILDMGTYLEAMQQYTNERAEAYCEFCENCMALEAADDDGGRRRRLADDDAADDAAGDDAAADDAAGDDAAADDAAADDAAADDAAAVDDAVAEHACAYYDECYNYADTCEANDDDAEEVDYEDFFQCQAFEGQNGKELYLGPHCANDGKSIIVGLYYDDMCTQYAGKKYNINSFTGMSFDESALSAYFTDDCVSCKESVSENTIYCLKIVFHIIPT